MPALWGRAFQLTTLAPILSSLRRMVEGTALARAVFFTATRRMQQQDTGLRGDPAAFEGGEHPPFAVIRKARPENAPFY